jgi:hypothetical protein
MCVQSNLPPRLTAVANGEESIHAEGFCVGVQDDLIPIGRLCAFAALTTVEIRLHHRDERIGLLRTPRRAFRLADRVGFDVHCHLAPGHGEVERPHDELAFLDVIANQAFTELTGFVLLALGLLGQLIGGFQ